MGLTVGRWGGIAALQVAGGGRGCEDGTTQKRVTTAPPEGRRGGGGHDGNFRSSHECRMFFLSLGLEMHHVSEAADGIDQSHKGWIIGMGRLLEKEKNMPERGRRE